VNNSNLIKRALAYPDTPYLWEAIAYLRGVAIIAVMINHYLCCFIPGPYGGYANGMVSIFFIVSGVSIFYHFEKRYGGMLSPNIITFFIADRIIRIFPLYALSLYVSAHFFHWPHSLWEYLGIHTQNIYWFMPALLQCYIGAPLFYLAIKRVRKHSDLLIGATLLFLTFSILLTFVVPNVEFPYKELFIGQPPEYRGLYFAHVYLFIIGMMMPLIIKRLQKKPVPVQYKITFLVLFMLFLHLTRIDYEAWATKLSSIVFIFAACVMSILFIGSRTYLPCSKTICLLGKNSYALYLFHISYYYLLFNMQVITSDKVKGALYTIIFFPIFLACCIVIEKFGSGFQRVFRFLLKNHIVIQKTHG
jgi:peptidoglycan/LPS O-acetylase OafA/YrhL